MSDAFYLRKSDGTLSPMELVIDEASPSTGLKLRVVAQGLRSAVPQTTPIYIFHPQLGRDEARRATDDQLSSGALLPIVSSHTASVELSRRHAYRNLLRSQGLGQDEINTLIALGGYPIDWEPDNE